MDGIEVLASWPGAQWLRQPGPAYPLVSAAHILAIGLIVGAMLPLDLRLAGLFRNVPLSVLAPFLSRSAAFGVGLAVMTGLWLFTVQPGDYLANPAFMWKMALLTAALVNVATLHLGGGLRRAVEDGYVSTAVRVQAMVSAGLWFSVLLAGRWIGFV